MSRLTVICLILVMSPISAAAAQNSGAGHGPGKPRELIAAVPEHWKPQYDLDKNGKPIGFAIDVMNEVAARAGIRVIYKRARNFVHAAEMLDLGEAHLIPNSRIRASRMDKYEFSLPVETYFISIFVDKNSRGITGLSTLAGKRLGVVKNHVGVSIFRGRNDIRLSVWPNIRAALMAMLDGKLDALVYSQRAAINVAREAGVDNEIRTVGAPLRQIRRGIRATKDNAWILKYLNPAIENFVQTPEYRRIYDKWFFKPRLFWDRSRLLWSMGGFTFFVFAAMVWWRYRSVVRLNRMLQAEAEEREAAEAQLRQAQKMEVVGQLTGGVAHDFNNLLAVIQGNIELLDDEIGGNNAKVAAALHAANRGAELTQRLLAFSRRQPLHPQPIDVTALVSGMSNLLKRTLGISTEVSITMAPDLWLAQADPGQLENALLNLAVNARDAMPNGGQLTISSENAPIDEAFAEKHFGAAAGDYVLLEVRDTGKGMAPDILEHAFEPFFTTKRVGQGSGLGLSMVYGFVKQSGGHIFIESSEGLGTAVKLYLPRALETSLRAEEDHLAEIPSGGGKLTLVLEDDPDVRVLIENMLVGLGYQVVTAATAAAATEAMERRPVDLVLSDVALPGGINGPQFIAEARARHPGLKVVFMSGYASESEKANASIGAEEVLLYKPFKKRQLARALHAALNSV